MINSTVQLNNLKPEELLRENINLKASVKTLTQQLDALTQQLDWFKRQVFGQKSERIIDELGNQLELPIEIPLPEDDKADTVLIPEHIKRKPTKGKGEFKLDLPDNIPVEEVIHELSGKDLICPKTGKTMVVIGQESVDKLAKTGVDYFIKRHTYIKYGVPGEALSGVKQAPAPPCIIEGSKFDVSFMVDLTVEKFAYHLPLNRVQERLAASEIFVSRQALSALLINLGDKLVPLYDLMRQKIFESGVIFTDDTPVKMIVKGHKKAKNGRMWIYLGGNPNAPPYHVYDFTEDWRHTHPIEFLKDFQGTFHADAYDAYEKIDKARDDVVWAPCWAHARREFERALASGKSEFCLEILKLIRYLFMYERVAWNRSPEERLKIRQECETELVVKIFTCLIEELSATDLLPSSPRFKAINYMLRRKENFMVYLSNPDIRMDNNPAERALRKVCLGKKNWMFVGSLKGGNTAAVLFSIVQTCRAMKINPKEYLQDIYTRLLDHPAKKLDELLPDQWQMKRSKSKKSAE
jgi:transposase